MPPGDSEGRCCHCEDYGQLVIGTYTPPLTEAAYERYLQEFGALYQRRQRFLIIFDATRTPDIPAPLRRRQAEWNKENDALLRRYLIGVAFVFSSPASRFVLSSMFLLKPLPVPYTVCATREEALIWAGSALRRAGIEPALMLVRARARPPFANAPGPGAQGPPEVVSARVPAPRHAR